MQSGHRTPPTTSPLVPLFEEPELLIPENVKVIPNKLEIVYFNELAGKFSGSKNFVQEFMNSFEIFYEKVVQNIEAWKPKPPKLEKEKVSKKLNLKLNIIILYLTQRNRLGQFPYKKLRQETSELDIQKISVWYTGLSEWKPLSTIQAKLLK